MSQCSQATPLPKVKSSNPDKMFCTMLEMQYTAITATIEGVLLLPLALIKRIKSNIKMVEKLVAETILSQLKLLEGIVLQILSLEKFQKGAAMTNFCTLAYHCRVLFDLLSENPLFADKHIDVYENFDKYVCNQGLQNLVADFMNNRISYVMSELDRLSTMMEDALKLSVFEAKYQALLDTPIQGKTIFQWLIELDKYAECAFGVCDYIETAMNKKSDLTDKLALNDVGTSIQFSKLTGKVDALSAEIDDKINVLRNKLTTITGGNCREREAADKICNFTKNTIKQAKDSIA